MKFYPTHNSTFSDLINFEFVDYKNQYDVNSTHRHNYFEMIFFTNGGGEQIIDFTKKSIEAFEVSIILPGQIHSLKRTDKTRGIVLQFKEEIFSELNFLYRQILSLSGNFSSVTFPKNKFSHLFKLVKFLKQRFEEETKKSDETLKNYLQLIISEFLDLLEINKETENNNVSNSFLELLEENFKAEKQVSFYAEKLNLNTRMLNIQLEKHTGKKALQIIHNRVILEIKRLLMNDDLSLKEITYMLNFDSPATFSRFVKKHTGKLPSELKTEVAKIHN